MEIPNIGPINAPLIGMAMKEMVRRAVGIIQRERFMFEATAKADRNGDLTDVVTSADKNCQALYEKLIKENFPGVGIIGEENNLRVPCKIKGHKIFFTVDPLDGTKAFVRRQSHGIGTMISLVVDGKIVAAYIGDVMSREIYGYRPESQKVNRITDNGVSLQLKADEWALINQQHVLLRERPECYNERTGKDIIPRFRSYEIMSGSIGTNMARLWKGEVGGAILLAGTQNPWDWCPVVGISLKLGFRFIPIPVWPSEDLQVWAPLITPEPFNTRTDLLIVHKSRFEEMSIEKSRAAVEA